MSNSYWDDIDVKVDDACPIATSDIAVNLKNRQKAIDTAGYGPLNPTKPNNEFWDTKAERWNVTADDARGQKCGNCAAFIQTKRMLDCIDKGLGNESGNAAWDVIDAGDLGYCEAFDFKCASSRTCDTWIVGGPITEEKENNMEEKSLEDMYLELLAIEEKSFEEKSLEDAYLELLAIEEKVAPIVPVRPDTERLRPRPEKRFGKPYRPGRGAGLRNMPWYKAEEEYEPEDDMLYDEDYMGDEEDDKAIMKPMSGGGGAKNPGSPRAADERQRGRQFMNWASGRSPSGDNVHPTSVGNMDIGDSGRRNVANSRMTDLMRNRSWTNPRPRPGVGSRATAINTGPPARPQNIQPAPLPTQNYKPKDKPKDWGSDNNAQLISGGIPQKSAWDEEAYYDYDFDMKKLPMGGGGSKPPDPPSPKRNDQARPKPKDPFQKFADHLNAVDIGDSKGRSAEAGRRQAGLKKYVGDVAIGAAGPASSSPIGDNRGVARPKQYLARGTGPRPTRGPGNPGAPKPRPTRGSGNPGAPVNQQRGLAAAGDYFSGRSGDPRATADQQATRGRERISKFGRDVIGDGSSLPGADRKGPQPKPGKMNRVTPSKRREDPPRQRPLAFNQAVPRQGKPSQGGLERAMRRQGKPSQSLLGENFSKSYDQGYDEYDEYENYLYQKSYDQGYEYDDYDEYDEYIDAKGLTDQQAAGLRAAGNFYSGRNVDGSSFGSADTMASRGKVRRSATLNNFGSEGPKRRTSPGPAPRPVRGPGNPGRTTNAPRPGNLNNKPSSGGGGGFYGETMGSRWDRFVGAFKGSDSEMYMDDDDEMAIPPDTNDKAEYTDTQRAEFRKFGDHLEARDIGDVDKRAAISAKRKAGLNSYVSAVGAAGLTHNPQKPTSVGGGRGITPGRPLPPKSVGGGRGLNPGNPGPNKRPDTTAIWRPGNRTPNKTPDTTAVWRRR